MRGLKICFILFIALTAAGCAVDKVLIPIVDNDRLVLPQEEGWLLIFSDGGKMKLNFIDYPLAEQPRFTEKDVLKIRSSIIERVCYVPDCIVEINTFKEADSSWYTCFAVYDRDDNLFFHGHGNSYEYLTSVLNAIRNSEHKH